MLDIFARSFLEASRFGKPTSADYGTWRVLGKRQRKGENRLSKTT